MEVLVAMAVGLVVIGGAVQIFSKGVDSAWVTSQRAELQQDARAASTIMLKDISLAGAGLPSGGVALASGAGTARPIYGCSFGGTCYLGNLNTASITYPQLVVGANNVNYLYGIIPGWQRGITINGSQSDVITVAYADANFLLNQYQVQFGDVNGNSITFITPAPVPVPAPQAVNNTGVGLQQGDLVLFSNTSGNYAIGEVTAPVPAGPGPTYTVSFGNNSPLLMNQNVASAGDLKQMATAAGVIIGAPAAGVVATRIWVITYYLDQNAARCPNTCLMRQVNGRTAVPVNENATDLRFTYDTYDNAGNLLNATGDGGMALGISPNQIRRININRFSFRSQVAGKSGYQSIDLETSVSARNLSFIDRYK
jgi:hypothetical protein